MDRRAAISRVRLFYRDDYVYEALEAGMRHTFDFEKPRRIRDALIAGGHARAEDFAAAPPLADPELLLVHTPRYLSEIRDPDRLARLLFLDPEHPWDERLLEPFLHASGGTLAAARAAARERLIGVNLGGGYHHARPEKAEGFCAIADVAIAIRALQREGLARRALIVDLDYHHGNGNAEIFSADESVFTFSVHAGNWCWISKRNNLDVELPSGTGDEAYLDAVRTRLPAIVRELDPDVAIYLAGADPWAGDALGDFRVTEAGMLERDRIVTRETADRGVPLAVVMAGGYGGESWRIPFNYVRWLLER